MRFVAVNHEVMKSLRGDICQFGRDPMELSTAL
jgi:hypothetical protein